MSVFPSEEEQLAILSDKLATTATEFSAQLNKLAVVVNADISKVVRSSILRVFGNIVRRSPVLTGSYRGSHGIANLEPSGGENIQKGESIPPATAQGWTWKVGDGDIWIYNNLPYALRLENGWSKQAPNGIYLLAMQEFIVFFNEQIAKSKTLVPDGAV